MNELDFLKEHWNKQTDYPIKTRTEIQEMLQKSSSNTLKWLIGANIGELMFFIAIGLIFGENAEKNFDAETIFWFSIVDYIIYSLPVVFSIFFIILINKINATNSVSGLINSILKARKLLNVYIYINFTIFIGIIYYSFYVSMTPELLNELQSKQISPFIAIGTLFTLGVLIVIIYMTLIWGFYKLLYGRFLKRLNNSLDQLKDME